VGRRTKKKIKFAALLGQGELRALKRLRGAPRSKLKQKDEG
jgi:hypothetical protein